jgi:hypothetical protein
VAFAFPLGDLVDTNGRRKHQGLVELWSHRNTICIADREPLPGYLGDRATVAADLVFVVGDVALRLVRRSSFDLDRVVLVKEREQRVGCKYPVPGQPAS